MKRLYFSLIGIITFVGFAALALADPGTTWDQQINGHGRFKVLKRVRRRGCFGQGDRARLGAVAEHSAFPLDGIYPPPRCYRPRCAQSLLPTRGWGP